MIVGDSLEDVRTGLEGGARAAVASVPALNGASGLRVRRVLLQFMIRVSRYSSECATE
ncbi:hypothetical protein SVIOM342S_10394 [Streptomyces violaceorubidus]